MNKLILSFSFLLMVLFSQAGHVGFMKNRFPLMDRMKDKGAGGGSGSQDEEDDEDDESQDDESDDEEEEEDDSQDEEDISKLPEWAQKNIKKLRKEAAKHRNNFKAANEKLSKLEKKAKKPTEESQDDEEEEEAGYDSESERILIENSILNVAVEHGVPKEQIKFFKFLMFEKLQSLEEGEELDDDDVEELIAQLPSSKGSRGPANSSFGGNGSKGKGKGKESEAVTKEEFGKMGIIARQKLYRQNPDLYTKLMKEVGI